MRAARPALSGPLPHRPPREPRDNRDRGTSRPTDGSGSFAPARKKFAPSGQGGTTERIRSVSPCPGSVLTIQSCNCRTVRSGLSYASFVSGTASKESEDWLRLKKVSMSDPLEISDLIAEFAREDEQARVRASAEILRIGLAAVPALVEASDSDNDSVWRLAVDTLARIEPASPGDDPAILVAVLA